MLESLDVLIGLVVVLLALSMTVTVITQAITAALNSRGYHLRRGLVDLLQVLDPAFADKTTAKVVASQILQHPLVSGSTVVGSLFRPRLGNVVHREEFIKLLIGLAATPDGPERNKSDTTARAAADAAMKAHGIDPKTTLEAIRAVSLQLERSSPELSNMARQSAAILVAAPNDFVAKINNWFDQSMDRTSQRFTASTRAITFAGALVVAFGLQVDTPSLVNRLAADKDLRDAFIAQGKVMAAAAQPTGADKAKPPTAQPGEADKEKSANTLPTEADKERDREREYRAFLATNGIIRLPGSDAKSNWNPASVMGMLITGLLLSLGAPFWYGALSQLLQLRSVLAGKDDAQRAERQLAPDTTAAAAAGGRAPATNLPAALRGERGDLAALG